MRPVVGPRGLEQGPDLGCFRLGIVAVRRLAIAVPGRLRATGGGGAGTGTALSARGTSKGTPGAAASGGPGRGSYRSNGQQAGDGQAIAFRSMCLPCRDCRTGRLRPDQASCSGRVGLRPDLSDFGLRRRARNATPAPVRCGGIAQDVPARRGQSHIPAPAYCLDPARSCRRRPAGCALEAQPRGPGSCRAAFASRSARGACRALRCSRRCASKATRCAPCGADQGGRQPEAQAVQALALMFPGAAPATPLAGGAASRRWAAPGRCWPRQRAPRP